MKSDENYRDCQPRKLIYLIFLEKIKRNPYGFKNTIL